MDLQQTSTWSKLSPPSYRFFIPISYILGHKTWCHGDTNAEISMVILLKSEVYHLLPVCHVHIKIRTNFSALECSVALFSYHFCISLSRVRHTHTRLCVRAPEDSTSLKQLGLCRRYLFISNSCNRYQQSNHVTIQHDCLYRDYKYHTSSFSRVSGITPNPIMLLSVNYVGNFLCDQNCKKYYCYDFTRLFDCFKVFNAVAQFGWDTALQAGKSCVRLPMASSFRPHYGPVVDSASKRNEHQEYFLGG
jgi:hypothetical protein